MLLLTVLAASSTCFLCLVPTSPAQSQGIPPGQRSSPPARGSVGNVDPDKRTIGLRYLGFVTNSHITVPVESGNNHPRRMAVRVAPASRGLPDWNWSPAEWVPYSSNVDLDLGESDGMKRVLIQGEWDDGSIMGSGSAITLLRSSPIIAVTNPPSLLTAQPMIQLKGYSDRTLASIYFDVINPSGTYTARNRPGFSTDQYFDRNLFAMTTDYFECLDIELSRGTNTIVLRCADEAGNLTTTNFYFVFTTAGHTNPPLITLAWPTNGSHLQVGDFSIRGQLDDPTATVMGWITDSQGHTQVLEGVVEREGRFWLDHVRMPEEIGYVSLVAFDAATNSSATNFTIHRGHTELKLDPLPVLPDRGTITVTGWIGRSNYAVRVNGVQAVVQPDGKWKADRVPVTAGGVAIFDASARPTDTNAPDPDAETNVPPPIYWGEVTDQIQAGVYFPAPPANQVNPYACDLYVRNTSGSNQSLSWVRPKQNARLSVFLYGRDGTNVPMTVRNEPVELLPNARMNIHHLGEREVDLIDGFLDLPANMPVRVASLHLADWFSLTPGQYILDIGPQLFHANEDGDLTPFDAARAGTNITVIPQP